MIQNIFVKLFYCIFQKKTRYFFSVFIVFIFFFLEIKFFWIERMVGNLLFIGNNDRSKIGFIWEIREKRKIAKDKIKKICPCDFLVNDRFQSFSAILANLKEGKEVMISCACFIKLYKQIDKQIIDETFFAYLILELSINQKWSKAYFEKIGDNISISLLDEKNIILEQSVIDKNLINSIN